MRRRPINCCRHICQMHMFRSKSYSFLHSAQNLVRLRMSVVDNALVKQIMHKNFVHIIFVCINFVRTSINFVRVSIVYINFVCINFVSANNLEKDVHVKDDGSNLAMRKKT